MIASVSGFPMATGLSFGVDLPSSKVIILDIIQQRTTCDGWATFGVKLYNAGGFTGIGKVSLYIDSEEVGSEFIDIQPNEVFVLNFKARIPMGRGHTVKAVYTEKFGETVQRSESLITQRDSDCDGWVDETEFRYGTNPYNADTDGDGIIDSNDFDPFRDAIIELYIFRARALDPAEDDDQDWNTDFRIEATFKADSITQTLKQNLPDNTRDVENMVMLGNNLFENIQNEAVAVLRFNPPDNAETVEIDLKLVDRDSGFITDNPDEIMDISPRPGNNEEGKVAKLFFSLKNGTWWGDDYINDHKDYFGYGHLSGADDSTEDYTNGGEYDAEPFSKYYDELEALGYDLSVVNITDVKGWDGIKTLELMDHESGILYRYSNPEEAVLFTLELPDGSKKRVLIINKRNAEVSKIKLKNESIKVPFYGNKTIKGDNLTITTEKDVGYEAFITFGNVTTEENTTDTSKTTVDTSNMTKQTETLLADVVTTSTDIDEDDAEIWFSIKLNDEDGIPFYKELELNRKLEEEGSIYRFDPSDGFGIDDPDFHQSLIEADAYGDYDGDGVPNAVELFIGKNPTLRDVLGVHLKVSIEWNASEDEIKAFIKSFQRASQVIYDYTDGYAVISGLTIYTSKRELDNADIQVSHDIVLNTSHEYWPNTNAGGGYWVKHYVGETFPVIKVPRKYDPSGQNNESNLVGPTDKEYWRMLGHELGHYLFMFGDEYMTWQGIYYSNVQSELNIELEKIPKTIMYDGNRYSEISYYNSYLEFNNELKTKIGIGWENYTTWQWYRWMGHSSWTSLLILLKYPEMGLNYTRDWEHYIFEKAIIPNLQRLPLHISMENLTIETIKTYTPFTGPYTGVGYYLRVEVNP